MVEHVVIISQSDFDTITSLIHDALADLQKVDGGHFRDCVKDRLERIQKKLKGAQ